MYFTYVFVMYCLYVVVVVSSKFILNHTDIVIHIVIYSIILHIQNIWCDLGYTQ